MYTNSKSLFLEGTFFEIEIFHHKGKLIRTWEVNKADKLRKLS